MHAVRAGEEERAQEWEHIRGTPSKPVVPAQTPTAPLTLLQNPSPRHTHARTRSTCNTGRSERRRSLQRMRMRTYADGRLTQSCSYAAYCGRKRSEARLPVRLQAVLRSGRRAKDDERALERDALLPTQHRELLHLLVLQRQKATARHGVQHAACNKHRHATCNMQYATNVASHSACSPVCARKAAARVFSAVGSADRHNRR